MKMKIVDTLAILISIIWMLTIISGPFLGIGDLYRDITPFPYFIGTLLYSAANLLIGAWLFYLAQKEKRAKWNWLLLGLVYGVLALALYFLMQIGKQHKPVRAFGALLFILIVASLPSGRFTNSFLYFLFPFSSSIYRSLGLMSMSKQIFIPIVNIGLGIWIYRVAKRQQQKSAGIWLAFTLIFGILAPILYFSYTTRSGYVDTFVERVEFGTGIPQEPNIYTTLSNPDVAELNVPLVQLKQIVIDTATYDFRNVERFLTYAVNYIGQEYLKNNVDVHLYGDQKHLHPNLQNSLTNICHTITNRSLG